eukprot:403346757
MKTSKRILTVVFLVILVSCYYEFSQAGEKKSRKINVKSPFSDFMNMIKGFKYDDVVAYFANLYWGILSPSIAGLFRAAGYYIYDQDPTAMDLEDYNPRYWFDFLMIPTRKQYTDFFGYSSHSTAAYTPTDV